MRIEKTWHDRQTGSVVRFIGDGIGRSVKVLETVTVDQNVRDVAVKLNVTDKKRGHSEFKRPKDM